MDSLWRLKTSPGSRRSHPSFSLPTHPYTPRSAVPLGPTGVPPVPPGSPCGPSRFQSVPAGPSRSKPVPAGPSRSHD
eukprot:4251289-Prymnesium_polylepis.1